MQKVHGGWCLLVQICFTAAMVNGQVVVELIEHHHGTTASLANAARDVLTNV